MDREMIGMCGTYCGDCDWKEKTSCPGCQKASSQMFWGECSVAKCSIAKGLKHCGHCTELPCLNLQDAFNNPEHGDNGERLINLKSWAKGEETHLRIRTINQTDSKDS